MRVLLTTDTVGGVWTYTKELTEGLLGKGCSVALVSFGASPTIEQLQWSTRVAGAAGESFRYIPSEIPLEWMPDNEDTVQQGAELLEQIVRDFKPDLLHSNQFCFGQLSTNIPKLLVAHSDVLSWADACIPDGLKWSPWLSRYVDMVQKGLDGATWLVAPTQWMMHALAEHFVLPVAQTVIANGRTLPGFTKPQDRVLQAVSAGRMWDPSKNLSILDKTTVLPVLIAGDNKNTSSSVPDTANASLVGFLQERELLDLFRKSHIYIAASRYEPFGLASLEAALCGCSIVANDIPSLREVWGSDVLYFTTHEQLDQQLTILSADPAFLSCMQVKAGLRAQRYSAEAMTERYLTLYRQIVSASGFEPDTHSALVSHVQ